MFLSKVLLYGYMISHRCRYGHSIKKYIRTISPQKRWWILEYRIQDGGYGRKDGEYWNIGYRMVDMVEKMVNIGIQDIEWWIWQKRW